MKLFCTVCAATISSVDYHTLEILQIFTMNAQMPSLEVKPATNLGTPMKLDGTNYTLCISFWDLKDQGDIWIQAHQQLQIQNINSGACQIWLSLPHFFTTWILILPPLLSHQRKGSLGCFSQYICTQAQYQLHLSIV